MARSDSLTQSRFAFLAEHRVFRDVGELVLVALAFLLYFVVRANVIDRPELALENARQIIELEQTLGIYVEASWQRAIIDERLLVRFFNFVYFWLDFPLIAGLGLVMYFWRRRWYTFTRDAILFSGAVALVCYALFPVAPPRLVPETGIMDTLQAFSNLSYQAQSTEFFVNPYAAMPSLHVGWAFLISIGVVLAFPGNRFVLVVALLYPIAQWSSTVFTGNHYFLDGVGGMGAAAAGVCFAAFMQRHGYTRLRGLLGLPAGEGEIVTKKGSS
jgi:membrane-associated phospholipid phosphatase